MNASTSEKNFWLFFWSTVLSIVGMDLYLFTHAWFLKELGAGKLSIGVSWAIFFVPSLFMLPICARLLKEYSVRNVQYAFEIVKALMLWVALIWLRIHPTIFSVYLLSACFGLLFSPFYPATYSLLKTLFCDERVVRYSNLFEVSLQLAGAAALFGSGFIYEHFGFSGIVAVSAVAVSGSCFFLSRLDRFQSSEAKSSDSWLKTYIQFFKMPSASRLQESRFWAGLLHQLPQSIILLSNIPLIIYVDLKMHGGPREYGYLDALYALVALAAGLYWSQRGALKHPALGLAIASGMGALGFLAFGALPALNLWPFFYISFLAASMTSSKVMSRATYIGGCSKEFVTEFTPLFQAVSNFTLILGAYAVGWVMEWGSVDIAMFTLAVAMLAFSLVFPIVQMRMKRVSDG